MNDANAQAPEVFDLRSLPPPEPLEKILSQINLRPPGSRFAAILMHEPFPLYGFLSDRGCVWHGEPVEGGYYLVITLPGEQT